MSIAGMRRAWVVALALIAGASLHEGRAQEPMKVRIGQATSAVSFLPIWSARALDAFKAEGLDLQWAVVAGGDPTTLAALDSGDIDFAAVGSETTVQAIAKGQPFQIVYSLMAKMSLELVVSEALLRRAGVTPTDPLDKRIGAIKGATIGVSAVRGAQERVARWLAARGGLDAQRDLKVALIGAPPAIRAALENGAIDGFVLSPPEGILAEASGKGRILVRLGDEFPELKTFHFLVLVAKKPLTPEKRELALRTIRALAKASDQTARDAPRVAAEIQKRFFAQAKPEIIARAVDSLKTGVAGQGRMSAESIAGLLQFTAATGGALDKLLDPVKGEGDFWTNELIAAALGR